MKKVMLATWLLAIGGFAQAQSSVTLYGRIDTGLEYMSGLTNGSGRSVSRLRAESGDWGTGMFGLKGVEDIGGSTKVIFQLEGGLNSMVGQVGSGTTIFNRWAYVGVQNDTYGTLTAGRMLWISNGLWDFDPLGQTAWSSASLVRGRNWQASSNNIAYQSPKWGGFDVAGQYALSNSTNWNAGGANGQGRSVGLQATYTSAFFQVRGIYDELRNPTTGQFDDVFNYSREYFGGLNVFLGPFKLQAAYQASQASQAPAGAPTRTQLEWGGLAWQATPAVALIGAVYHVNANNGGGNATIYTIAGSYNLSKRTLLNVQVATARNSRNANFSLEANGPTSSDNPLPGHSQSGIYAGIQHAF
ncbi:porin [Burkholderia pseudomallei]|uniref:porin n=1 Tax=Burkholderia pseudomallei TaxID=28450 RepID=UPI000639A4A4|nr:porin [Burkholderia pseudomallei]ARK95782.1 porin [Burkholderia pseudomallei]KKI74115.1 porin [Burkholderia pseudomallei]MBO2963175.1 porin [Burkholderia pseudomallei]OND00947.1 porin [Burkholderia pseudomallei]OND00976.1 porin [Burkholderia pseudomallei]